ARDALHVGNFRQDPSAVAAIRGHVKAAGSRRRFVPGLPPHPPGKVLDRKRFELLVAVAGPGAHDFPDRLDVFLSGGWGVLAARAEENRQNEDQIQRTTIKHQFDRILPTRQEKTESCRTARITLSVSTTLIGRHGLVDADDADVALDRD